MLSVYQAYVFGMLGFDRVTSSAVIFAADNGTTVAIVLALLTLVGTVTANAVGWYKIKADSKLAAKRQLTEDKKSSVEIAQDVMSQTVTFLNERLQIERKESEEQMKKLRDLHDREISGIKAEHARDMARLEVKIDVITQSHDECKQRNRELISELEIYKNGEHNGG